MSAYGMFLLTTIVAASVLIMCTGQYLSALERISVDYSVSALVVAHGYACVGGLEGVNNSYLSYFREINGVGYIC